MPVKEVLDIRPTGWETDPPEERCKLSPIDATPNAAYNHYMLFFRMQDSRKKDALSVMKRGLEVSLSQARHLCGTIEKDPEGGHSFVKAKDTTVKLVVHWLDAPEDAGSYPSFQDLEKAHFGCHALGDLTLYSPSPDMVWDEGSVAADPDRSPTVSAYQITFLRGGMLFSMHSHHWASDLKGWNHFTLQLADNCRAIANGTPLPPWDPACIDVSRFIKPVKQWVDGPAPAQRHPDHRAQHKALLFHMPKSKAARLKALASVDGEQWVSTYDAVCAYLWRQLTKARAPLFRPDPASPVFFGEAINMRPRLDNPRLPARMMRNVLCGAFGNTAPVPQPTVAQVLGAASEKQEGEEEYPLSKLAQYIRRLTVSCDQQHMDTLLDMIAPIRDKRSISLRVDALPPLSLWVTDHRSGDVSGFDFGLEEPPVAYRHLWGDNVTPGLVLIYAPMRNNSKDSDEGCMFTVAVESEVIDALLGDPEWTEYFEYRGID